MTEEVPTKEFCEKNPTDERCSCYNVVYLDCKKIYLYQGVLKPWNG